MDEVKIIELKKSVLADNDADAELLREELRKKQTFYLNLMSSPGSGKTSTILETWKRLKDAVRIGVIEADIDSDVDARHLMEKGIRAVQVHTGGMCHLDAQMSRQGLEAVGYEDLDLVILENVGNLVCPAEFDTGACSNAVILSVPEGDDKPLKYPLMFEKCEAVLINKMDALPAFDFDMDRAARDIRMRKPDAEIFPVSTVKGDGMDAWCGWLLRKVKEWQKSGLQR